MGNNVTVISRPWHLLSADRYIHIWLKSHAHILSHSTYSKYHMLLSLFEKGLYTHTHTHTHTYIYIYSSDVPRLSKAATDAVNCEWTCGCHAKCSCRMNVKWLVEKLTMHLIFPHHWYNRNEEYCQALIRVAGIWTKDPLIPNYSDKHYVLH
jgi:hypothetical protein